MSSAAVTGTRMATHRGVLASCTTEMASSKVMPDTSPVASGRDTVDSTSVSAVGTAQHAAVRPRTMPAVTSAGRPPCRHSRTAATASAIDATVNPPKAIA